MLHVISTFIKFDLFIKSSKSDKTFIRGLRCNDWVTEICEVMSDFNDKETWSSWLMYYLGIKWRRVSYDCCQISLSSLNEKDG